MGTFAEDTRRTIQRLKNYYDNLIFRGYSSQTATDKVFFDNGDIEAIIVMYALGIQLDYDDTQLINAMLDDSND